jgi:phosphopantetheinyl transferase
MHGLPDAFEATRVRLASVADRARVVTVGACRLQPWQRFSGDAAALLDPAERSRAERMKHAHDRQARTLAYALHRVFIGALLGIDPRQVPLARDVRGRPVLQGSRWRTSLSHAHDVVAFAAAPDGAVGIDVEPGDSAARTPGIADEILHPSERRGLEGLDRASLGRELLATWCRKEAFLKASGTGLDVPMHAFALPEDAVLPLAGEHPDREQVRTGLVQLLPDCLVALCRPPDAPVVAVLLDPE